MIDGHALDAHNILLYKQQNVAKLQSRFYVFISFHYLKVFH